MTKLYEVANEKFFDVPCSSKQSFICTTILGDTNLAISQKNIEKFVEYASNNAGKITCE